MCGISVIVALHGQNQHLKPVSPQENDYTQSPHEHVNAKEAESRLAKELNDSLELIKHRGPDDRGQWISPDRRVGPRSIPPVSGWALPRQPLLI